MARARSSLPVPLSPVISRGGSKWRFVFERGQIVALIKVQQVQQPLSFQCPLNGQGKVLGGHRLDQIVIGPLVQAFHGYSRLVDRRDHNAFGGR